MTFRSGLKTSVVGFLCILGLMAHFGCEEYEWDSSWKTQEITIDGKSNDWLGHMAYMEDKAASIGILNDGEYLYLCLIAESPILVPRIMGGGLTVWFDPQGKTEKSIGIKYPVGREEPSLRKKSARIRAPGENPVARPEQQEGSRPNRKDFQLENFPFMAGDEIEILKSGEKQGLRLKLADIEDLELSITATGGLLTYEMKIPLQETPGSRLGIGNSHGKQIGIGFETGKFDQERIREAMPDRGGMGGRRGMGGGGIGGRGGMSGDVGNRREMSSELKIWIRSSLANNDSETIKK